MLTAVVARKDNEAELGPPATEIRLKFSLDTGWQQRVVGVSNRMIKCATRRSPYRGESPPGEVVPAASRTESWAFGGNEMV